MRIDSQTHTKLYMASGVGARLEGMRWYWPADLIDQHDKMPFEGSFDLEALEVLRQTKAVEIEVPSRRPPRAGASSSSGDGRLPGLARFIYQLPFIILPEGSLDEAIDPCQMAPGRPGCQA